MYVWLFALWVLQLLALVHAMLWGWLPTSGAAGTALEVHTQLHCAECLRVAELTLLS